MASSNQLSIGKIKVLVNGPGTDIVYVDTNLPSPFPAEVDDSPLTLKFEVQASKGVEYVFRNFPGVLVETIDYKTGERNEVGAGRYS